MNGNKKKELIEPISPPPKINGYYKGRNIRHLMTYNFEKVSRYLLLYATIFFRQGKS